MVFPLLKNLGEKSTALNTFVTSFVFNHYDNRYKPNFLLNSKHQVTFFHHVDSHLYVDRERKHRSAQSRTDPIMARHPTSQQKQQHPPLSCILFPPHQLFNGKSMSGPARSQRCCCCCSFVIRNKCFPIDPRGSPLDFTGLISIDRLSPATN